MQRCSHCVVSVMSRCSVISLSHFLCNFSLFFFSKVSFRCLMMLRSSLNEWLALKMAGWLDWSGIASGLSLCASARGPSGLRVWPIKKSPGFIHYDPAECSFPLFRPQEKLKYISPLAAQQCRCFGKVLLCFFFPSPFLNRMVNFQSMEKKKTLPASFFALVQMMQLVMPVTKNKTKV